MYWLWSGLLSKPCFPCWGTKFLTHRRVKGLGFVFSRGDHFSPMLLGLVVRIAAFLSRGC